MDEIGYLADGIADSAASIGLKRTRLASLSGDELAFSPGSTLIMLSSLDILKRMQDVVWMAKMKVCGQSKRLWEAFLSARGDGDEVCLPTH